MRGLLGTGGCVMLTLTKEAAQELKMIKDQLEEALPGGVLRLLLKPEGEVELVIDVTREEDEVLYSADEKILAMDMETSRILADVRVECKETPQGRALILQSKKN